jgi:hypothetical protein
MIDMISSFLFIVYNKWAKPFNPGAAVRSMNKKDIAHLRRQFKLDHDLLKISDILNVYIIKESSEVYHWESQPFAMLERDQQELYMDNFKKLLSGELDRKLFELTFQEEAEGHSRHILHQGLMAGHTEEWRDSMLQLVGKMLACGPYSQDTVVTFIRGEYFRPVKSRNEEAEESDRDEVYTHPFLLCSINKTEQPKKALLFDYADKVFKSSVFVDPIIKLSAPEAGFFYPSITDHASDVNRILYAAGKANVPDLSFIEDVLNAVKTVTAQEERIIFEEIVKEVAGEKLDASTLSNVYEEVHRIIEEHEEEEPPTLDFTDVERVLKVSGVEDVSAEKVEQAFQTVIDDRNYEFKAKNVMPKFNAKSIKIETKVATISVSPQDLKYVKQVNYKGKRCILIEVDEELVIEGFTLETETL